MCWASVWPTPNEVAHRRDFPTIALGSRIIVPRDKFMEWIDEQAAKKSEIF